VTPEVFDALVFWLPVFLFSATAHEAAHAWAAWRGGDATARDAGQVSLSPWPHVRRSPLGMLVVPIVASLTRGWTIGWASAPYDRLWADQHPRRAAAMAAAGPAANLLLAAAALALLRAGLVLGLFQAPAQATLDRLADPVARDAWLGAAAFLARGLSVMVMANALLAAFNLLPVPPLDGAMVITLALPAAPARRVRAATALPGLAFVGLLAAWQLCPMLTRPLLDLALGLLYRGQY